MELCFWCNDPKHLDLAQGVATDKSDKFKSARIGFRSQNDYFSSYEPCDKCKDMFAKGIQVIEVSRKPFDDGRPPILNSDTTSAYSTGRTPSLASDAPTVYPTGRTALIRNDSDLAIEIKAQSAETSFIVVDPEDMVILSPYFYKGDEPI